MKKAKIGIKQVPLPQSGKIKVKKYYYIAPALLGVFMFASNFLNTELFKFDEHNFSVWFILSLFSFACGWLIDKTLEWKQGGKFIFGVIVGTTVLSVVLISLYSDYFGANELLIENLILYSLRNVTLGSMGFFGMALAELFALQRVVLTQNIKIESFIESSDLAKKESELLIREAKLKSETMLKEAEISVKQMLDKKDRVEKELKEFIQIERELLKKYEEL